MYIIRNSDKCRFFQ